MRTAMRCEPSIWMLSTLLALSVASLGPPRPAEAQQAASIEDIVQNFQTSLHNTRIGKDTFYSAPIHTPGPIPMGGFSNLTGAPYESLSCRNCHAPTLADGTPIDPATYQPSCRDCHVQLGDAVADSTCLGCHSPQRLEHVFFSDVHRDRGMGCTDCHTPNEMHGDGNAYASLQEPGALEVSCEGCHPADRLVPHKSHQHVASVDCTACHVQSVIACNSCHFESALENNTRYYAPPMRDFKLLMQKDGKVRTASFQSLSYDGQSFYVIAPFATHSITAKGSGCTDCHLQGPKRRGVSAAPKPSALSEYVQTGRITVTRWNETSGLLIGTKGVIPVPPDWREALQFDFVVYDGLPSDPIGMDPSKWSFLKTGADMVDMPYGEPLSEEQMRHLIQSR